MVEVNTTDLVATIEKLQSQVKALSDRLSLLETPGAAKASPAPASPAPANRAPSPQKDAAPVIEAIPEEIVLVISAALGAFLGERAHLRHIRLISSQNWATQGRVSIQASHRLR